MTHNDPLMEQTLQLARDMQGPGIRMPEAPVRSDIETKPVRTSQDIQRDYEQRMLEIRVRALEDAQLDREWSRYRIGP